MKTFINVRYPLIAFLSVLIAILSTLALACRQFVWGILAFFILSAFVTLCFVKRRTAVAVVILASFVLGAGITGVHLLKIKSNQVHFEQKVVVSGYVCDSAVDGNVVKVVIDNVSVTSDNTTTNLSGKAKFYVYDNQTVPTLGEKATVVAKLNNVYVFRNGVQAVDYCNGVYYKLSSVNKVTYGQAKPTLDKVCLNYVKTRLQQVSPTNGNVAYALLTGDRSLVQDGTLDGFRDVGVMHVFAVSGLHVSFLVAVLGWILDKLKVRRWAKFGLLVVPLVFYCYVCGFPASVVRATVMTAVALIMQNFWRRTDLLNSVSIAGVILLAINPLNLFNPGFLLSFGAVYGIATVYLSLSRYIDYKVKGKFLVNLLKSLALSLGATAGTVLISAHFFGSVATFVLLANLVVVPVVSVIFICSAISLLPLFFGYFGIVSDTLLGAIKWFANLLANLPFATVSTPKLGVSVLFWVALLFVLGSYVNLKGKAKTVVCIVLSLCVAVSCLVANLPRQDDGSLYLIDGDQDVVAVASDGDGNYLVVSNCTTVRDVEKICDRLGNYKVNSLHLAFTKYKSVNVNALQVLLEDYVVDKAYVFDQTGNTVVDNLFASVNTNVVVVPPNRQASTLGATCIADGVPLGLKIVLPQFTFVVAFDVGNVALQTLQSRCNAQIIYSNTYNAKLLQIFGNSTVLFGEEGNLGNKNSLTECGNFTISCKSGTIKVTNTGGTTF